MTRIITIVPRKAGNPSTLSPLLMLVLTLLPVLGAAQAPDTLLLARKLPLTARFAAADHLDNLYVIRPDNQVEKYNPAGALLTRYSNNQLGQAASLDVSNPLKALLWYADFRTAVFLDRSLTPLGMLNLIDAGYPEVRTLCIARDGNLWIYDEVNFKLRKIQPDGIQLFESQALNLLFPERLNIVALQDDGNRVYAVDPAFGLLIFDVYGQYLRVRPLPGITHFYASGNFLEYICNGLFFVEKSETLEMTGGAPLPTGRANRPSWLSGGKWLVAGDGETEVYAR